MKDRWNVRLWSGRHELLMSERVKVQSGALVFKTRFGFVERIMAPGAWTQVDRVA